MPKNKNIFELDPERLATTDEDGHRVYLYPENVSGKWHDRRGLVYWFLIGFYLVLPWINIKGKPALKVDIVHREFVFLGGTIHGVEPILMFLALITALFFMAFMTSVFGRVWCGWACPQTVFIQSIFMKIDSLIEGTPKRRRDLEAAPWTIEKIFKRSLKWGIYLLISLHIAHTFVGYFVGPRDLLLMSLHSPFENWEYFLSTMILTVIFLADFGWFREQFCLVMCPYGRIQSVMMDENSLNVTYDVPRGEPRTGTVAKGEEGDCVNCYHCVKVCPTGIDIRRGTQLECIQCTMCIDACDNIMDRVKKPRGLIKYASGSGKKHKIFTPRSMGYGLTGLSLLALFFFSLSASTKLNLVFLRSKIPFTVNREGKVMNNFQLKLSHQGNTAPAVELRIKEIPLSDKIEIITPNHPTLIDDPDKKIMVFFRFDRSILNFGQAKVTVQVEDALTKDIITEKEVSLVGPVQ